jgi:pentatricopeptide repeat protein
MPPAPVLVPSKGVLRVLRHIAFASSAGAAVVVETRRRRIRAVEELHENAKKIRSSRRYHSTAATGSDDRVRSMGYSTDGAVEPWWNEVMPIPYLRRKVNMVHPREVHANASGREPTRPASANANPHRRSQPEVSSTARTYEPVSTSIVTSQHALSYRIDTLLAMGNIVGAMGMFFRYFHRRGGFDSMLLETSERISTVCKETNNLALAHKFHRKLAGLGLVAQSHWGSGSFDELIKRIENLLEVCKVRKAVITFMDRTRGWERVHIEGKAAEVIGLLFQATLRKKLWHLTVMLFWRLNYLGYKDSQAWIRLLQAHSERGEYKMVTTMYQRFRDCFELDHVGLAVVLRALIAQLRLSEAETLLRSALKPPWLPLGSCFTILLGGIWRVTKDLNRTIGLFEWMRTWFHKYQPTAALFNAMIQACAEVGRMDRVESYTQLMKEHHLEPNFKTRGHFLLAKAKNGHWREVEMGLQKIREDGLKPTRDDASVFNPLLVESSRTRSVSDTESFLLSAIEKYSIIPDVDTFNIMSNAFIRAGEFTSLARLVNFMKRLGLQPDAVTFNTALHGLWRDTKLHHMEVYRIFSKVQQHDKSLVNERTKNTIRSAIAHDSRKGSSRTARSPVKTIIKRNSSAYQEQDARSIHVDMICALSQHDKQKAALEALELYNKAKASGVRISREMVETAFQASMLCSGGFHAGMALVRSAHKAGVNCTGLLPLVISEMPNEASQLPDFLLQVYRERDRNCLEITHYVSVTAASRLVNSHRAHAAIDILTRVMRSEWGKRKPLDIAGMTVLLKAYASINTLKGVKHVVDMVLSRRMRIDTPFMRELRAAVARLEDERKKVENLGAAPHHMRQWIRDCRNQKSKQREEDQKRAKAIVDIFTGGEKPSVSESTIGAIPVTSIATPKRDGVHGSTKTAQSGMRKAHISESGKTLKEHQASHPRSTASPNTATKIPSTREQVRTLVEENGGELREVLTAIRRVESG